MPSNKIYLSWTIGRERFSNPAHVWVAPRIRNRATLVGGKCSQRCATLETKAKQYPVPVRYINYYLPPPPRPILDETLTRPTITATLKPNNVPYPRICTLEDHWQNKWGRGGEDSPPSIFRPNLGLQSPEITPFAYLNADTTVIIPSGQNTASKKSEANK